MNWEKVRISTVATQIRGVSYKPADVSIVLTEGHSTLLRANNITENGIKLSDLVYVKKSCISEKQKLKKGDILIAASSGSKHIVGRAISITEYIDAGFGAFCKVIRPKENINSNYLGFYFRSPKYRHIIANLAEGANINNIRNEDLDNLQIPLPPIHTQKLIAEILNKADSLRKNGRQLLQHYNDLAQSMFIDIFGDPVNNEKGWTVGTIRDLSSEVKYGTSKPALENGDTPYLRMNNLTYSGEWDFKDLKYITLDANEKEKYCLKRGDVVFNRTNSKELVGKTSVYNSDLEMAIAGYLIRIKVNNLANPFFISAFLNSKYGKAVLKNMCKNIIGMANINAQELQNINIPIPPIILQNKFADQIQNINQQKENLKEQIQQTENLFQVLLQRAFNGSLN